MAEDKKLADLLAKAYAGDLPKIDDAVQKAGYTKGPGWTVYTTGDVARFFGLSDRRVRQLIKDGLPRKQLKRYRHEYDLSAITEWMLEAARKESADPLLQGEDTPELEKLRRVQREIHEIKRDQLRADLLPRSDFVEGLHVLAATLRSAADLLLSRFGNEAQRILSEAVDDYEAEIDRRFPSTTESAD